jgi:8-oxo-dGTP pyrophosphatase MutT (NUDIX family)
MQNKQEKHFIADIAMKAIIEQDGKVLLAKVHNGMWELPGGRINEGEEPEIALIREVKEELDLDIEPGSVFDVFKFTAIQDKIILL